MDHADDLSMKMTVFTKSLPQYENMFAVDGDWTVSSVVKLTDDKIDSIGYERLQTRLRLHQVTEAHISSHTLQWSSYHGFENTVEKL